MYLLLAHMWFGTSFLYLKLPLLQKQDFVYDGKYPHVVYVEKPKTQDFDFSDAMIYQAKTTSEMEGKLLPPSPLPMLSNYGRVHIYLSRSE
jgi:hypothetical protein